MAMKYLGTGLFPLVIGKRKFQETSENLKNHENSVKILTI